MTSPHSHQGSATGDATTSISRSSEYPFPKFQGGGVIAETTAYGALQTRSERPFGPQDENDVTPTEASPLMRRIIDDSDTLKKSGFIHPNGLLLDIPIARFYVLFSLILLVFFLSCFDATIMSSSHPVITSYFGSSNSASWMSTAFMLTQTCSQPLVGRLSDGVGRKIPFLITTFLFAVGTLGCAVAPTLLSFILARAVCGIGAGGCLVLGTIVVSDIVPISRRGTYQSLINANYGVSSALGAALGGWMADALGWRWEFGIQVPPLLICFVLMWICIPDDIGRDNKTDTLMDIVQAFDWAGSFFLTVVIISFVFFFSLGGNIYPWSHPIVLGTGITLIIAMAIFLDIECRVDHPVMPLWIITKSPHMNLIFSNVCAALIINSVWFNVPLYFQAVVLTSATESGLNLVAPIIASCLSGVATGIAVQETQRTKWPLFLGALLITGGLLIVYCIHRGQTQLGYILYMLPAAFGQGFLFPGTFMAILNENCQHDQAVVTSSLILWRSIGQISGIAGSSLIVQNALKFFLEHKLEGPDRDEIIQLVRKNVEAVASLKEPYLEQVIQSYEGALKLMFFTMVVISVVPVMLIWPVKLRALGPMKTPEEDTQEETGPGTV